jgi:serine phosphatase RsbU (regulator of sigma subunit)
VAKHLDLLLDKFLLAIHREKVTDGNNQHDKTGQHQLVAVQDLMLLLGGHQQECQDRQNIVEAELQYQTRLRSNQLHEEQCRLIRDTKNRDLSSYAGLLVQLLPDLRMKH